MKMVSRFRSLTQRRHGGEMFAVLLCALTTQLVLGATPAVATTITTTSPQSEATALHGAKWTSNVKVSYAKGSWTFSSPGIPTNNFVATNYAVPSNPFDVNATGASIISASTALKDQNYDYTLPLVPSYSKTITTAPMGPIGVMINGAVLYDPYEANDSTVATSDNFITSAHGVSASFLDSCDGHPGGPGEYHYHGLPACLVAYATGEPEHVTSVTSLHGATTAPVSELNSASRHPVLIGVAFDGFAIYDNVAMSGHLVAVSNLDACNGIFSPVPGYPHGIYHYVLENVKGARSSVACFHGVVSSAYTRALHHALSGATSKEVSVRSSNTVTSARSLAANPTTDAYLIDLLKADARAQC